MKKIFYFALLAIVTVSCSSDFQTWKELNEDWLLQKESKLGLNDAGEKDAYILDSGVLTDGVQYEIFHVGYGATPKPSVNPSNRKPNSQVKVKYTGWTVDGVQFETNKGVWLPLSNVIQGWQSALSHMPAGSHWKVYIPWQLAYGEKGSQSSRGNYLIPPYSTLVFDIELLEVINY